jgi:PleD family two-component response regulator
VDTVETEFVIVVTDDAVSAERLRSALARTEPNYLITWAKNRREMDMMPTPRLILLDLMLSTESPFDVLRWIRGDERYRYVPVFALGSDSVKHFVDEAYKLGANSCILSSPEPEESERLARGIASYVSVRAAFA